MAKAVELMCASHLTAERIQKSLCRQIVAWASSHLPVTAAPAVASEAGWKASRFQETTFLSVWKSIFRACRGEQGWAGCSALHPHSRETWRPHQILESLSRNWNSCGSGDFERLWAGRPLFRCAVFSLHVHSSMRYNLRRADLWMRISPGTKEEKIDIFRLTLSDVVI